MAHLEPTTALATCEQALRELCGHVYPATYGQDWLARVSTEDQRAKWEERRTEEAKRRKGVVAVSDQPLAYTEFYELCEIAEQHWEPLAPALGKQKQTLPLLRRFESLRNPVAHSRPMLPFEADLMSGIAGEFRNRVTIYLTAQDPAGDYFARIESVTDSFGREIASSEQGENVVQTGMTLHPGDVVTFTCRATDPQGRDIAWTVTPEPPNARAAIAEGSDVEISWTVIDANVSERCLVGIRMIADAIYHRHKGAYDGLVVFGYRVLPAAP